MVRVQPGRIHLSSMWRTALEVIRNYKPNYIYVTMGSYWSSEDPRIALLEARIAALEQSKPSTAPTLPRRTKPVVMPHWHGKLMEEISKRRQSMRLA